MNLKKIPVSVLTVLLFFGATSHAQVTKPSTPFIQRDICPFECCQYGKWTAHSSLTVFEKEGDDSKVSFILQPGEEFTAITGNVHIMKLGERVFERAVNEFVKGEKIYILSYRGEGFYDLWYNGKLFDVDSGVMDVVITNSKLLYSAEFTWWVLIKNKLNKQGWLKLKNITDDGFLTKEKIAGSDACS